jgi:hypothetical protein
MRRAERERVQRQLEAERERASYIHHTMDEFDKDWRVGSCLVVAGQLVVRRVSGPSRDSGASLHVSRGSSWRRGLDAWGGQPVDVP